MSLSLKNLLLFGLLMFSASLFAQPRFRMASNGAASWTSLGGGKYQATVNFLSDQTGQSFLPTAIDTSFYMVTGTEQRYKVDSVLSKSFTQAVIRVLQQAPTASSPIGQVVVYDPDGFSTIGQGVFGSLGVTAQINAAIDEYNARQATGGSGGADTIYLADGTAIVNGDTLPDFGVAGTSGHSVQLLNSGTSATIDSVVAIISGTVDTVYFPAGTATDNIKIVKNATTGNVLFLFTGDSYNDEDFPFIPPGQTVMFNFKSGTWYRSLNSPYTDGITVTGDGTIGDPLRVIPGSSSVTGLATKFAPDTDVSPDSTGAPSLNEIRDWNNTVEDTAWVNSVIFYTGTDDSTDATTYIYVIDENGVVSLLESPSDAFSLQRRVVPGPAFSEPSSPTEQEVLDYIGIISPPIKPGTIMYQLQSAIPSSGSAGNPQTAWIYDGANVTRIKDFPRKSEIPDVAFADTLDCTVGEVYTYIASNPDTGVYKLYYNVGAGTVDNPDWIWMLAGDKSPANNDIVNIKKPGSSGGADTLYLADGTALVNGDTLPDFATSTSGGLSTYITTDSFSTFRPLGPIPDSALVWSTTRGAWFQKFGSSYTRRSWENGTLASTIYSVSNDTLTFNSNLNNRAVLSFPTSGTTAYIAAPDYISSQAVGEIFQIGIQNNNDTLITVSWNDIYGKFDGTAMPDVLLTPGSAKNYQFQVVTDGFEGVILASLNDMGGGTGTADTIYLADGTVVVNGDTLPDFATGRDTLYTQSGEMLVNGDTIPIQIDSAHTWGANTYIYFENGDSLLVYTMSGSGSDLDSLVSASYNGSTLTLTLSSGQTVTASIANVVSGSGDPVGAPGTGQRLYIDTGDSTMWLGFGGAWHPFKGVNVPIIDIGGFYTSTEAEGALQELGDSIAQHRAELDLKLEAEVDGSVFNELDTLYLADGTMIVNGDTIPYQTAENTSVSDENNNYVGTNVEAILDEIASKIDTASTQVDNAATLLSYTAKQGTVVITRRQNTSTKLGGSYYYITNDTSGYWLPNDSVCLIKNGSQWAVLNVPGSTVTLEQFGAIGGTGKSQSEQTANWKAFKKAIAYANRMGKTITPGERKTEYEFYVNNGDGWTSTDGFDISVDIRGCVFRFFPRVKSYQEYIFDMNGNSKVEFKNGELHTTEPSLETYTATLKPGGVLNQIVLTSSAIRAGFAADVIGQTILASYDYDQKADTCYVTAYDSGTKTLTLSQNIDLASATSDDAGWVALAWASNQVQDTIDTYKGYWLMIDPQGLEPGFTFVNYIPSSATNSGRILFDNIKTSGFYDFASKSTGAIDIIIQNCNDLQAHSGLVSSFSNSATDSRVIVKNAYIHHIGYESKGQYPGHQQNTGDRWNGGTFYCHPNVSMDFDNVLFDSCVATVRNYSATGTKPLDRKFINSFKNCEFKNQMEDYQAFTSLQVPTIFSNCTFNAGTVWVRNDVSFSNCTFDSTIINSNATDATFNRISIQGGEIRNGTLFTSSGSPAIKESIHLNDIAFAESLGSTSYGSSFQFAGRWDTATISNVIFVANTGGNSSIATFEQVPHFFRFTDTRFGITAGNYLFYRNTYPSPRTNHIFRNCTVIGGYFSQMSQLSTSYRQFTMDNVIGDVFTTFPSCYDLEFPIEPYQNTVTTSTIDVDGPDAVIEPPSGTGWLLDNNYNQFFINGTGKFIAFSNGNFDRRGEVVLTARGGSVSIPAYNANTSDSISNFYQAINLSEGESARVFFDNTAMTYDQAASDFDTIGTWVASATEATYWNQIEDEQMLGSNKNYSGYRMIPGSVMVIVGSDTLTDASKEGTLASTEGTGATGFVGYYHNFISLNFLSAPSAGTVVKIDYDYANVIHNIGMFRAVDGNNSPESTTVSNGQGVGLTLSSVNITPRLGDSYMLSAPTAFTQNRKLNLAGFTLFFGRNSDSTQVVFNDGKVGIGFTPTTYQLDVRATQARTNLQSTTGTNSTYYLIQNTGGLTFFGTENNAGGNIVTGSTAYASVFGNGENRPVQFATNNAVRATISGAGNTGLGVTSPTAVLHLKAGTATASTAPLKFTSGTLLSSAEAGAVEFLTDKLYASITTGAARKEITLNDAALTEFKIPKVTTNGRIVTGSMTDSLGNIGINKTPTYDLDILGTTDNLRVASSGTVADIRMQNSVTGSTSGDGFSIIATDADVVISNRESGTLDLRTNNTTALQIDANQYTIMNNRLQGKKGADVAAANDLTLGDGNLFHITGATQINAITTTNWQAGSEVTLIFDSTPTVKNNTAGGGGTAVMLLAGGADFSATANDVLKLVYDGTSWLEVSRSVN